MNINMSNYAVRNETGEINVGLTCAKFKADLVAFESKQKTDLGSVTTAIHAVFDEFPKCNVPALISLVAGRLGTSPVGDDYKTLGERVRNALRSQPDVFQVAKGRDGGATRLPVKSMVVSG